MGVVGAAIKGFGKALKIGKKGIRVKTIIGVKPAVKIPGASAKAIEAIKLFYENNFKDFLKKKDEIVKEVTDLLGNNTKIQDLGIVNHTYDKSGKSKATTVDFFLNTGGGISVYCTDWSEEMDFTDNLKVFAVSKELDDYFETVK